MTQSAINTALNGKQAALSAAQLNAVNSGITSTKVNNYDTHVANGDIHVTAAQKTAWTNKQDKLVASGTGQNIVGTGIATVSIPTSGDNANKIVVNVPATDLSGKENVLTFTTSGSGNVVTGVSKSGSTVTVTKGTTLGSLATKSAVASGDITDGTIVNADISDNAAIDQSKISGLSTSLSGKVNVAQGTDNKDKVLITNATTGNVETTKFIHSDGYSANATDKDTTIPSVEVVEDIVLTAAGNYVAYNQTADNKDKAMITNAAGQVVPGQIATGMIADSAVTTDKINAKAVTAAKIADSTITATQLASNAVTTAKIKDANVTAPKLADGVVASGSSNVTVTRDSSTKVFKVSVTEQDISGKEDVANKVTSTSQYNEDIADANNCDYNEKTTWEDLLNEFKRLWREGERV
jgi:hypothetical protein